MRRQLQKPWIGVDLDGTLAFYDRWRGDEHIGLPIFPMIYRVQEWVRSGKKVKVFTARVAPPADAARLTQRIQVWLEEHGLPPLEVTCIKDMDMVELWDDRAIQVRTNEGEPVT